MITTTPHGGDTPDPQSVPTGPIPNAPDGGSAEVGLPGARWWVVGLAAAILVVAIVFGYLAFRPIAVEVSIDGRTQAVDTRAESVGDLLTDMELAVSDRDAVEPPLDAELTDGDTVTVRYARPVAVVVDGSTTEHITTMLTVGDALAEVGAPMDGAAVSVSLDDVVPRAGLAIEVVTPKSITVDVGGEARTLISTDATVEQLLETEGIELVDADTVEPSLDSPVAEAMSIVVTRIRVTTDTRAEAIAHDTVEQDDAELTVGTREVRTAGVDGSQDVTYTVTYTNGEVTAEEALSSVVTQEPVSEIVAVGTKRAAVVTAEPSGATAELNWAALADCESSGNPTAVNPAGYYGLYQFSPATWASVGGSGNPADASVEEQTRRAHILYERSGPGQWPHCGPRLFN